MLPSLTGKESQMGRGMTRGAPRLIAMVVLMALAFPDATSASVDPIVGTRVDNPLPQQDALFGSSVAGMGDIDGDGIGEFAVGASGAGRAYILSGATGSVLHAIDDPDDLTGTSCEPTVQMASPCLFGFAVASAGDINGDGVDDLGVGAPGQTSGIPAICQIDLGMQCPQHGRAFVFSGATGGVIVSITATNHMNLGAAVAALGDVNGDSIPDIAFGEPNFLGLGGLVAAFSGADGTTLWEATAVPPDAQQGILSLGQHLAGIGDLNGDGRRDLIAGAPLNDTAAYSDGRVAVLSGSDGAVIRLHDPTPTPNIDSSGQNFGAKVAAVGDQDGDGIDDYAVGEPGRSTAAGSLIHLFSGATGAALGAPLSSPADQRNEPGLSGERIPIAGVDDKDGDGAADFWVGANRTGMAFLINKQGEVLASVEDQSPGSLFGAAVSAIGALGGTGELDAVVGAPGRPVDGLPSAGAAFLLRPNQPPTATLTNGDCSSTNIAGGTANITLFDPDGDALTFTLASNSNPGLVPNANILIGGSANTRAVALTSAAKKSGSAALTFNVSDGQATVPFVITVIVGTEKQESLDGSAGTDMIFGLSGADTISGDSGNDLLCGGNGNDTLSGGDGDDVIDGENGDDSLSGGSGDDVLRGSLGNDILTSGSGADFFGGGPGIDTATDFSAAQGDTTDGSFP